MEVIIAFSVFILCLSSFSSFENKFYFKGQNVKLFKTKVHCKSMSHTLFLLSMAERPQKKKKTKNQIIHATFKAINVLVNKNLVFRIVRFCSCRAILMGSFIYTISLNARI